MCLLSQHQGCWSVPTPASMTRVWTSHGTRLQPSQHGQPPRTYFQGGSHLCCAQRCRALMAKTQGLLRCKSSCLCPGHRLQPQLCPPRRASQGNQQIMLGRQPVLLKSVSKPRIINNTTIGQHIFTFFRREVMDDNCTLGTTLP